MGQLKEWRDQKWVRIGADGSILGECGTSPDKKNPDRCLPKAKVYQKKKELLQQKRKNQQERKARLL